MEMFSLQLNLNYSCGFCSTSLFHFVILKILHQNSLQNFFLKNNSCFYYCLLLPVFFFALFRLFIKTILSISLFLNFLPQSILSNSVLIFSNPQHSYSNSMGFTEKDQTMSVFSHTFQARNCTGCYVYFNLSREQISIRTKG